MKLRILTLAGFAASLFGFSALSGCDSGGPAAPVAPAATGAPAAPPAAPVAPTKGIGKKGRNTAGPVPVD